MRRLHVCIHIFIYEACMAAVCQCLRESELHTAGLCPKSLAPRSTNTCGVGGVGDLHEYSTKIGRIDIPTESAQTAGAPGATKLIASFSKNLLNMRQTGVAMDSVVAAQSIFAESAESATFTNTLQKKGASTFPRSRRKRRNRCCSKQPYKT